ncbi:MAG: HPF/RaiA family ribosome-associated protein [Gemmatimonadales bacterium]
MRLKRVAFSIASPTATRPKIRLHVRGGQVLVASAAESDHRTALDRAEDKIRRQLERP